MKKWKDMPETKKLKVWIKKRKKKCNKEYKEWQEDIDSDPLTNDWTSKKFDAELCRRREEGKNYELSKLKILDEVEKQLEGEHEK